MLHRALLSQPAAAPAPRAAEAPFPAWMIPATRISWYVGSASIPGMSQSAVQDDNGNWVDPQTGRRYANADNPATAGAGVLQFDLLQASNNFVAVSARNWLTLDVNGSLTSSFITGYAGDARSIGDYWMNPAVLLAMPEQNEGGLIVRRRDYPLNGRNYKAIAIQNSAGGSYQRMTYDLETGLLLVGSGRTVGAAQRQIGPNGQIFTGEGVTTITSTVLQDLRQMQLPWANDPAPNFVRQNWQAQYKGTHATAIPGTEGLNIPPSQLDVVATATRVDERAVVLKYQTSVQAPYAQPQQSETARCTGAAMIGGLWINPRSLAQLQPGAVIDEDRITRVRTSFVGVQNNIATIVEQSVNDSMAYSYDMQSGLLVGAASQQKSGVATMTAQVQLVGQR